MSAPLILKLKEFILYNNEVGTKENVPLSESSNDFNKIKVNGYATHATGKTYFSTEIENPNGKDLGILVPAYNGGSFTYLVNEIINFNGSSIVRGPQWDLGIGGNTTRIEGEVYITKVVGYK